MKDKNEKIAKVQLQISENCTEKEASIINAYWKLEEMKFVHMPKEIKEKFEISLSELSKLVAYYSTLSLFIHCANCNSYENHKAKSKTQFTTLLKKAKINSRTIIKCSYCTQQEREQFSIEEENRQKELLQKFDNAIANKNWTNLTKFERGILLNCLTMNIYEITRHYGNQLGKSQFILLIKALENIEKYDLLALERDPWTNYIVGFQKLDRLSFFREEISVKEEIKQSSVELNSETDELKFKLFIEKNQQHPDSPTHGGTFISKERIVIEPGVEYIYGFWPRANENLYLTMVPLKNLDKLPIQKRISDHPISLQKGIEEFLRNLGKNL
jgi:hypothetical protein